MTDTTNQAAALSIAWQMSNAMFNFAQKCGHTLTSDDVRLFDSLHKQWDAAQAASQPAGTELPKWIDDAKGKDPFIDDLIVEIERLRAALPAQAEPVVTMPIKFAADVLGALFNGGLHNPDGYERIKQEFAALMRGESAAPLPQAAAQAPGQQEAAVKDSLTAGDAQAIREKALTDMLRRARRHIQDWWRPDGELPPAKSPELVEDIDTLLAEGEAIRALAGSQQAAKEGIEG